MSYNKTLLNSVHKPLIKAQGGGSMIEGRPTVKQISQMPNKNYKPSDAVMNTKAGLAAASMVMGPLAFIPNIAAATYDLGTSARYAMDGQWENAGVDLVSAGLNALTPAAAMGALKGLSSLSKANKALRNIKALKTANDLKDISEASSITDRFTGRVQEFNRAGQETFSRRPRTAEEVRAYNQKLKGQYRTGSTPEGPEYLRPYETPDFANGGMITDSRGQYAYPGMPTRIPGSSITMKGIEYPVLGIGSNGVQKMMQPGGEYSFGNAEYVDEFPVMGKGGQHGGLDRWFAEKWVDVKTGKACGRQDGESRRSYPACRPSKRVNSDTPKTSGELSSAEREKFKRSKTSSERINYQHRRKEDGGEQTESDMANKPNNPALWSRAKSLAREKFDVYPSAYANGWAAKWYKGKGGSWRKAEYGMEVMGDGGTPDNPGFNALPESVQQKIMANMAYGGYMPEMMAYGGDMPEYGGGGYTVTRSNDRKGKTHKVTGPDGTVKYFGDSKMGQHPKDEGRKAAFYARHKKNLEGNPYFRAFARATWEDGGMIEMQGGGPILMNEGYRDPNWARKSMSEETDRSGDAWVLSDRGAKLADQKLQEQLRAQRFMTANPNVNMDSLRSKLAAQYGTMKDGDFFPNEQYLKTGARIIPAAPASNQQVKNYTAKAGFANGGTNNPGFEALPTYVQAKILSNMGYGGYYNPYMQEGGFYDNSTALRYKTVMQDNTNNDGYTQNLTSATSGVTTYADGRPVERSDMYGITKGQNGNQRYKEFLRIQNGDEAPQYSMQKSFKPLFSNQYKSVSRPISAGRGERRMADMEAFYAQSNMAEGGETPTVDEMTYGKAKQTYYDLLNKQGQRKLTSKKDLAMLQQSHNVMTDNMRFYEKGKYFTTEPFVDAASQIKNTFRGIYNDMAGRNYADGGEANGEMAMGQMAAVADKMSKLLKFVQPTQNLDPWIASKLAVMDHSADAISDYMMYGPDAQMQEKGLPNKKKGGSTFSGNAWYQKGGMTKDSVMEVTAEQAEMLRQQGYQFEIVD